MVIQGGSGVGGNFLPIMPGTVGANPCVRPFQNGLGVLV